MSPEKKGKKKSSAKTPSKRAVKTPPAQNNGGGNGPFYVLVIIILVTIIVLLLNRFYEGGKFNLPSLKILSEKSDSVKEKNDAQKEKGPESKTSESSADKEKDKNSEDKISKSDGKKPEENISAADKEVTLYFLKFDEKSEKIYLSTVKRKLPDKQILSATMEQLIKGPTAYEQGKGYITAVPSHLKIRSIDIKGKTAEIDFNGVIEEGAAGDILLKRVQQIVNTATQFENVESIIIRINGQRRKTIGGDGFSIGGPLRR